MNKRWLTTLIWSARLGVLLCVILQLMYLHSYVMANQLVRQQSPQAFLDLSPEVVEASVGSVFDHTQLLRSWNDKFGVIFSIGSVGEVKNGYVWKELSASEHNTQGAYYRMLDETLSLYHADTLAKAGLTSVILVDDLKESVTGTALLGFADTLRGVIYLNIDSARADTEQVRSTLHHEFAHILFARLASHGAFDESMWPKGAQSDDYVSKYARTSPSEDVAEAFAYIMRSSEEHDLSRPIGAKIEMVRSAYTRFVTQP